MTNAVRIALISDIHAYTKSQLPAGAPRPSFVEVSNPSDIPGQNPFVALQRLIEGEAITADYLVCCGDIGDKAHPDAIRYAWERIRDLSDQLGAEVVVTSGNHDMDSRFLHNEHDAKSTLQGLKDYPFKNEAQNNEYWAKNVVVSETANVRWVILNSAAYHGYTEEWKHGRVSKRTLAYLDNALAQSSQDKLNILVCHHHVYKIGGIDLGDYSEMQAGSDLLKLLESGGHGNWLVLHGHKHWPSVTYAYGSNSSPVVFSAGSLSAVLYDELMDKARNQFYLLELATAQHHGRVRGTFRAWDWVSDEGFSPAQARSGLPHFGGFGSSKSGAELAADVKQVFDEQGRDFISWSQLIDDVADLKYSTPADMVSCREKMQKDHGLIVLDNNGFPSQVGRTAP